MDAKSRNARTQARIRRAAMTARAEDQVRELDAQLGAQSIVAIYRDRVLTQRTRRYELLAPRKKTDVEILHTLLGIELKIGRKRLLCPDLATARYLSIFARLGCSAIALPYDITQISWLADELESGWHRMLLLIGHLTQGRTERFRKSVVSRVVEEIRASIEALGAGNKFPEFNQKTRQRP